MSREKFYITTPIYYPNDIPHIGHAYTTLAADIIARWQTLLGKEVFFLTGTDEHGKKIELAARQKGKSPKAFVDELIPSFVDAWKKLNIRYSRFLRTTEKEHEAVVQSLLNSVRKKGDIYLGTYEGYYCTDCEAYYTEKDAPELKCPIHHKTLEKLQEKSYFFKLSKYQKQLLSYYKKNKLFLSPEFRSNEIINRVSEGLQDLSISRTSFSWGIPIPFDEKHITYVWFDALANYLTGIGYLNDKKKFKKFWPADVHLVGKDISWFHCVIWPAMLFSAGIEPPRQIFSHGWWTFDKEKISKSRGKVINVDELIAIAGVDSARYFLFRETPFGQDGDFSEKELIEKHNNELANKLGNLFSRVTSSAEKNGIKKIENKLIKKLALKEIEKKMEDLEIDKALSTIFSFIDKCNEYIQEKKPWESETTDKDKILYELIDSIKAIAILLWPFIPETSEKIARHLDFEISYENIKKAYQGNTIKKADILFKKI
ncbi:methionine--tRNA ligase [Candidatus Pacearchaeota archaeon]|nr:methionine--tRNA ligase [Candidatus Pacearchaeota archaeon]